MFIRSIACGSAGAQSTSALPDPERGWGTCAQEPDLRTTLTAAFVVHLDRQGGFQGEVRNKLFTSAYPAAPQARSVQHAGRRDLTMCVHV